MYTLIYNKNTFLHKKNLEAANLIKKVTKICEELQINPYPINSKQLYWDLKGKRSIRINLQHRLVYEVVEKEKIVKVLSMWSHYE
jgi:toxin YoeB